MADDDATFTSDSDLLYEECSKAALNCEEKFRKVFNQDELLDLCKDAGLKKIFDLKTLMPLVQTLSSGSLFITLKQKGGAVCWSLRPRDAAQQVQKLSAEEKMVYIMIEESHSSGVWVRNIKKRSNLTDQGLTKVTDKLCKLRLAKAVRNIRAPAQKTYMLYHLAPNDDVTGGSFYDGGELDENLVEELANLIVFHVRQAGWVEEKRKRLKRDPGDAITIPDDDDTRASSPEETRGRKKRKISHSRDIEDSGPARKAQRHDHEGHGHVYVQIAHAADHNYPDAHEIHGFITNNDFIRAAKASALTVDEVQNIINMLVWDGRLETVNNGYRTVRGVKQPKFPGPKKDEEDIMGKKFLDKDALRGNGLTEMPCGRCPVRDICGTGGPINASSCVYFEQWLDLALDVPDDRAVAELEIAA